MHEEYNNGTYESCKDVFYPATNGSAMDVLCGPYGAEGCAPDLWFEYLGSTSNGFSPFDIIYEFGTDDQKYYNPPATPCDVVSIFQIIKCLILFT